MSVPRFLVVLDADSTLIQDEVIELLAEEAGRKEAVAAATDAAMRGEIDFAASLRDRVALLVGVPVEAFARVIARVRPTPGIAEFITAVHDRGGKVCVVSGGFHEVLDTIASQLGLDDWQANRLQCRDGILTGATEGTIVDASAKASALGHWAHEFGVSPQSTIAIGDGANDLPMLASAALGIAFNAKPAVRAHADIVLGRVDFCDAIALLPG